VCAELKQASINQQFANSTKTLIHIRNHSTDGHWVARGRLDETHAWIVQQKKINSMGERDRWFRVAELHSSFRIGIADTLNGQRRSERPLLFNDVLIAWPHAHTPVVRCLQTQIVAD
jgi:hypothetical protein